MNSDDWDLQAVVRGCYNPSTAAATSSTVDFNPSRPCSNTTFEPRYDHHHNDDDNQVLLFSDTTNTSIDYLHDLLQPFFPQISNTPNFPPTQSIPIPIPVPVPISSPLSVLGGLQDLSPPPPPPPPQNHQHHKQQCVLPSSKPLSSTTAQTPRSKRRKNVMKRVCHVPAEGLSSDMWSWRKYGQKPIKGSPYPRGYYRCSTSKGCLARKQVERNRSDPDMFIVTYTAEHNHPIPTHRNSLAGSTRQKNQTLTAGEPSKPTSSPLLSPADLSPATEKVEEDEEDDLDVSDMVVDDDFFVGLEDVPAGDCFSGDSPMSFPFPWLASNATTTAAGGG